jgi:hypothetical protein
VVSVLSDIHVNTVYTKTLLRALEILGVDGLCARLEVPQERLDLWMTGRVPVPTEVFLRVVDFLFEAERRPPQGDRFSA